MNDTKPIKKVLLKTAAGEQFSADVGVPLPKPKYVNGPRSKLSVIECGQSVLFTENKADSLRTICWYLAPKKFTIRQEPNGVRVWRIK